MVTYTSKGRTTACLVFAFCFRLYRALSEALSIPPDSWRLTCCEPQRRSGAGLGGVLSSPGNRQQEQRPTVPGDAHHTAPKPPRAGRTPGNPRAQLPFLPASGTTGVAGGTGRQRQRSTSTCEPILVSPVPEPTALQLWGWFLFHPPLLPESSPLCIITH